MKAFTFPLTIVVAVLSGCARLRLVRAEDLYYNDDMLSSFLNSGSDILAKCQIDYNSILQSSAEMMGQLSAMGDEPVDYDQAVQEIKALARQCTAGEAAQFNKALEAFHTCSGIDLQVVLESFADALVGTMLQCTLAIAPLADQVMEPDFSIPEICIESFLGQNPVGDLVRSYLLTPDKTLPCFSTLSKALPECTLEKWPIPLIGKVMKQFMCILGGSVELVDEMASAQMLFLSTCLPDGNQSCEDGLSACTEGTLTLMLPKPLQGAPLSDAMIRAAEQEGISDVVPKYNAFVEKCIPDRWAGWAYEMGAYEGSQTYNKQSPQESLMQSPAQQKNASGGSSSSGGSPTGPFMGGLLTGFVLVGGFWAYTVFKAKKRDDRYRGVEMVGNDLSLT